MVDFLGKYLIIETVEQQLTDAIKNHQAVSLYYKGYKGTTNPKTGNVKDATDSGLRYVIPVALGVHKDTGSMVLRALVTSKGVHTAGRNRPTKWRMFRIDRITSIYPHEDPNAIKDAMPELYHQNDKDMSIIYAQADYGTTTEKLPSNAPSISSAGEKRPLNVPNVKSVLKVPVKPAAPAPLPTQPAKPQPTAQPKPQPITPPQGKKETSPVTPPVTPTITPPVEPNTPEDENKPKPISEWYHWLNKIINN